MVSTLRPVRQPLLQAGEGGIGVLCSAGSDVGKAAHHVIEQQATDRVGQPDEFRIALFEWHNILDVSQHVQLSASQRSAHSGGIV
jgi:hypothetical protein